MTQPSNTTPTFGGTVLDADQSAEIAALLTHTAQQAVLPRKLDEGIYAILNPEGGVEVVETEGYRAQREQVWQEKFATAPRTVERTVTVLDVASFVDYLTRNTAHFDPADLAAAGAVEVGPSSGYAFGDGQLEVWADIDARTIKAYLDGVYGWRKHSATLQLKVSREWAEWAAVDGKLLTQVQMAEFIEDHISTIAEPAGAVLLDVTQTLQAHTNVAFKQQAILANGQRQFRWEETVEAKAGQSGNLTIPGELTLVLRPFQGSQPVPVIARFRYQVRDGGLSMGIKLAEPDKALEDAFAGVVGDVQASVPVHINHGRG